MHKLLRSSAALIQGAFWYVALMVTLGLVGLWPGWSVAAASPWWLVYTVACFGVILAFAVWGRLRRRTLVAVMVTGIVLDLADITNIGIGRVVAWAGVTGLVVFAVELVRQNMQLVRELRQHDPDFGSKVGWAVVYWLPMLLFCWVGMWGHGWLVGQAEQLVYDTTPIDMYCHAEPAPVPCEGFAKKPLAELPLSLDQTLEYWWEKRFRTRQQQLIQTIESSDPQAGIPDDVFMNKKALSDKLQMLNARTSPNDVLGIEPPNNQLLEDEIFAKDPVMQTMRLELDRLAKQSKGRTNIPLFGGSISNAFLLKPRIALVEARMKKRGEELLKQYQHQLVTAQQVVRSMHFQLSRHLAPQAPLDMEPVQKRAQVRAARAYLAALVVTKLADLKKSTLMTARSIAEQTQALHEQDRARVTEPREQLEAIGFHRLCSNKTTSMDITFDRVDNKPTPVNITPFECPASLLKIDGVFQPIDFFESLNRSIRNWRQQQEETLEATSREALVQITRSAGKFDDKAMDLEKMVPKHIHLGRSSCYTARPGTWGNCLTNYVKSRAEAKYSDARAEAGRQYEREVADLRRTGLSSGAELVLYQREQGREELQRAEDGLHTAVLWAKSFLDVLAWMLLFFVILAFIKSLFYTIALKLYNAHGPSFVQVDESNTIMSEMPRVAPTSSGVPNALASPNVPLGSPTNRITFTDVTAQSPLITHGYLTNQAIRTTLMPPWPFSGVLSRLLRGRYYFYNVGGPIDGYQSISWDCPRDMAIADWPLQPGEEVVFHYRNFFGASQHVKLHSRVILRLDTMLLGRFTFHSAKAMERPGHLLLTAKGISAESVAQDDHTGLPERFIAWHVHTAFQVEGKQSLRSIYTNPFQLVRYEKHIPRGRILIDASPIRPYFYGIFRYALRVASPF